MEKINRMNINGVTYEIEDLEARRSGGNVTPQMYGAKADGVTDDTAAVQSALATGKAIELTGHYHCPGLTISNATIIGNGDAKISGLVTVGNNTTIDGVELENVIVVTFGNATNVDVKIFNCVFAGTSGYGLKITTGNDNAGLHGVVVEKCQFKGTYDAAIYVLTDCSKFEKAWITSLIFRDIHVIYSKVGLLADGIGSLPINTNSEFAFINFRMQHIDGYDECMIRSNIAARNWMFSGCVYYDSVSAAIDVIDFSHGRYTNLMMDETNVFPYPFNLNRTDFATAGGFDLQKFYARLVNFDDSMTRYIYSVNNPNESSVSPTQPIGCDTRKSGLNISRSASELGDCEGYALLASNNVSWGNPQRAMIGFSSFQNRPAMVTFNKNDAEEYLYLLYSEKYMPLSRDKIPSSPVVGYMLFDTTSGKPVWYNGSAWVDANGTVVNLTTAEA